MDCDKCGECCRKGNKYSITLPPRIAKFLSVRTGRTVKKVMFVFDKDCPHLTEDNLCGIYENRPDACVDFYCKSK